MQLRMSLDLDRVSCADLVGFVNAVQASGTAPDTPVEHVLVGSGDDIRHRLEVLVTTTSTTHAFGAPAHPRLVRPPSPGPSVYPPPRPYVPEQQLTFSHAAAEELLRALNETLESVAIPDSARASLSELRDRLRQIDDERRRREHSA
jgi:hypothetical protein